MAKEKKEIKAEEKKEVQPHVQLPRIPGLPQRVIVMLADEIAKTMVQRLPALIPAPSRNKKPKKKKAKVIEHAMFLDTSAIIDGRIFDIIQLGLINGVFVVTDSILRELKHIADSQDMVRRERGRRGLDLLEKLKKMRGVKMQVVNEEYDSNNAKPGEIDERIIKAAKLYRGKIITCDYNLDKKANIDGVTAINVNAMANALKVTAVPGEALHITVQHIGKELTQGVGYLDDGTMIVVEDGFSTVGQTIDVVVSRVIQTATGRILFAKKI